MLRKSKNRLAVRIGSMALCASLIATGIPVSAATWNDGIFTGSGTGYQNGTIKVQVTVSNDKIDKIETVSKEKQSYWDTFDIESLYDAIKEKNGTDGVDAISGATLSSKGVFQAVNDALEKAGIVDENAAFSKGDGTESNPYIIHTAAQLTKFAASVDDGTSYAGQYVKLDSDIDLSSIDNFNPIGQEDGSKGKIFAGTYDGDGHTVSGLKIKETVEIPSDTSSTVLSSWGLFSTLDKTAVVKNIIISAPDISIENISTTAKGQVLAGAVAGITTAPEKVDNSYTGVKGTIIDHCIVDGESIRTVATGAVLNWAAGILGRAQTCTLIENCYSSADIDSQSLGGSNSAYAAGIVGTTGNYTTIVNCGTSGKIKALAPRSMNMGGIAGGIVSMHAGILYNVYSNAEVTVGNGGLSDKQWIGAIAGYCTTSGMQKGTDGTYGYKEEGPYRAFGYYGSNAVLKEIVYDGTTVKEEKTVDPQATGKSSKINCDTIFPAEAVKTDDLSTEAFAEILNKNIKASISYLEAYQIPDVTFKEWTSADELVLPDGEEWVDGEIDASIFAGGSGTSEDPYTISNQDQLRAFALSLNSKLDYQDINIALTDDIDISDEEWIPVGKSDHAFAGTFDGKGHTVSGMTIGTKDAPKSLSKDEVYMGFFGVLGGSATVKDLTLTDVCIYTEGLASDYVGAIAGYTHSTDTGRNGAVIDSCTVKGTVSHTAEKGNQFTGGMIGYQYKGALINSYFEGNVSCVVKAGDLAEAGGLVGLNNRGLVANCHTKADIYGSGNRDNGNEGMAVVSNLIAVQAGDLVHCFAQGNVTTKEYSTYAGMVSGWITGVGKTYQCGYSLDGTMIIGEDTSAKQIVDPVEAIGTKVSSGVNDEGEIYTGGLADANIGYKKADFAKAVESLNKTDEFPIDIALYALDSNALKKWQMSEEELAYSEEYSKVIYVQPECEKVVREEAVMKDGTWYGRNDEKTSVVKITVKDHAVTETTVVSGGSDGDAYNSAVEKAKTKASYGDDTGYGSGDTSVFAGGSGTKEDPYRIADKDQLVYLSSSVNADESWKGIYFKQTADIDLSGIDFKPIGSVIFAEVNGQKKQVGAYPFCGNYDGGNYTISGLTMGSAENPTDRAMTGLFGVTAGECGTNEKPAENQNTVTLSNINLKSINIYAGTRYEMFAGGLTGNSQNGFYINNCHVQGMIHVTTEESFNRAGGLAGSVLRGQVRNSSADVEITAETGTSHTYAGGLFGMTNRVTVVNSYALGNVTANSENNNKVHAGGLTGQAGGVQINCYAKGDIISLKTTSDVGGINGRSGGIAADMNCYYNTDAVQKNGNTVNETNIAVGVNANDSAFVSAEGVSAKEMTEQKFADTLNENAKHVTEQLSEEGEVGKFLTALPDRGFTQVCYYDGEELSQWIVSEGGVVGFEVKKAQTPDTKDDTDKKDDNDQKDPSNNNDNKQDTTTGGNTSTGGNTNTGTGGGSTITKPEDNDGTADNTQTVKTKTRTVTIPATKKVKGKKKKVTSVAAKAYANDKTITKLVIGKNVKKIGKRAFYGCSNIKTIIIKTEKLKESSIGADAFKGISKNAVVKVPKKLVKKYKKILRKKGLNKKIKVVAM